MPADHVELTGEDLTIEQVVGVARERWTVSLSPQAIRRVACCRVMVEELVARGEKVYGLTTGFGKLRDVSIAPRDLERLQVNLIRSHSCGVGIPFDEDVVRAAMLLRANTLCRGHSGIRPEVIQAVVDLLNDGVYPFMPQQGSVGASGDLAPLSHLALVVMGDPEGRVLPTARRKGRRIERDLQPDVFVRLADLPDWKQASLVEATSFTPVALAAKEGLALNNGTQVMSALGCLVIHDANRGLAWAELATAMSLEAQSGVRMAFQDELHRVRDLSHQADTAQRILGHTAGSQILDVLLNTASLRRARTYLGEAREHLEALDQAEAVAPVIERIAGLTAELNLLVPREGEAPEQVLRHRAQPARTQIEAYGAMMAPLLRLAANLLHALEEAPPAPLAREALVRALHALGHAVPAAPPVQDDYSLRCAPQVIACAHRALEHAQQVIDVEINSATDNPLLFPPEPPGGFAATTPEAYLGFLREPAQASRLPELVLGGGNFHGEPVGMVMDYLTMALAEVGNISERRTAHLVDEALSNGLPPFLIEESGLNSGFMIPQYTAAALVSENKVLCHPATVDSIPTCAGSEDHVSMGTIAARQTRQVLENVLRVLAIEVLAAFQALEFRAPLAPGRGVSQAVSYLRQQGFTPAQEDRVLHPDLERLRVLLESPLPTG